MKLAFISTVITALAPSFIEAQAFYGSCRDLHVSPFHGSIRHNCRNENGQWIRSELDLSYCVRNQLGQLQAMENGQFANSCTDCWFEANSAWFTCLCSTGSGNNRVRSRIDLNNFLTNVNGRVRCYNHWSRSVRGWGVKKRDLTTLGARNALSEECRLAELAKAEAEAEAVRDSDETRAELV